MFSERKITAGMLTGIGIAGIVCAYMSYQQEPEKKETKMFEEHNDERKELYFLKQGEAEHNVRGKGERVLNNDLPDPQLTKKGLKLANSCRVPPELYDLESPNVIILCSPLRRCLQTCLLIFADYCRARKIKIHVWDMLQGGRSDQPCLIGSSPESLKKTFREYLDVLDLSDIEENRGYTSPDRKLIRAEVMGDLRDRLAKIHAKTIIISAHTYTLCGVAATKKMKLKYARIQRWNMDVKSRKVCRDD